MSRKTNPADRKANPGREAYDKSKCAELLLNYACQAKCRFCSQDFAWRKTPNLMPFRRAAEQIYLAYQKGYRRLGFTGGEPTLRKDLPELIAIARKVGFGYIRIQTNGLLLADPAYARKLAKAGLSYVKFSMHSHAAKTQDALTGVPGSFDAALKAMQNLRRLRVGLGNNLVINKLNHRLLREFYEFFVRGQGITDHVLIAPIYEGNLSLHVREMGVRLSVVAPHIRAVYEQFHELCLHEPPLLLHLTPCILPGYEEQMLGWSSFNTIVVNPDGRTHDLDKNAAENTTKAPACAKCVYNERCIGLDRSYAEHFGTDELRPLRSKPARYDAHRPKTPPRRRGVLTDNESCVLLVLRENGRLTTAKFMKIASRYGICKNCKDENALITAAERLSKLDLVERKFSRGAYSWSLSKREEADRLLAGQGR